MRTFIETRGRYDITCYEVDITNQMRAACFDFARQIILSNNQYSRLLPNQIRTNNDIDLIQRLEIQRTYMGKIGEVAFLSLLREKGKNVNADDMFVVYEGQENVDSYDFKTANGATVDIKTGFMPYHSRLLVNCEQFDGIPKNYYVGVKLNATEIDRENKLADWESVSIATIYGYVEYDYLSSRPIENFGEGPAKWIFYNKLMGIDRLIRDFR